ncbi:hypothetical protein [Aquimarina pacifica]|uniref:hypothetical protein n=1 Tax=Aquimarina pacifica TaxID=1296415 RepID=UPI000472A4A4|nr:hypothetical protein [Aquimarina pacifica]
MQQQQYNVTIELVSHIILTKPDAITRLIAKHGITYQTIPSNDELVESVLHLMKTSDAFIEELGDQITIHAQQKSKELISLEQSGYITYHDNGEDEFFGSLLKVGLKAVGGLIKKGVKKIGKGRKKGRKSSSGSSNSVSKAIAQTAQIRKDLQNKIRILEKKNRSAMVAAVAARRKMEKEHKLKQAQAKKALEKEKQKNKKTMIIGAAILGTFLVGGTIYLTSRSKPSQVTYMPNQPMMAT